MRCVSCNRILTDAERLSYKYICEESNPDLFVRTDEIEDMCHVCKHKMKEANSYLTKDYAHAELTEGITAQAKMSDYL